MCRRLFILTGSKLQRAKSVKVSFIAVEKSPPFLCAVYFLGADDLLEARQKYQKNLLTYRMCKESGIWNGYSEIVTKLEIWKP
jgi:hypothetical protein